jgi:site-specific DNA-methyltransferase (adenine-specific)
LGADSLPTEAAPVTDNHLFYGDNLDVLRRHIKDETVDLVYLDPPFKSDQNYNVLFAAKDGTESAAQIQAFEDTWHWDEAAARQFDETVEAGGSVADVMLAFRQFLGTNDMLAYLAMMAPRLVELRRVMKPTASIYLHCDPTASHYLKLLMDAVFGPERFRNEIVWRRSHPKGHAFTRFATSHDVILAYAKGGGAVTWHPIYVPNPRAEEQYGLVDTSGRRYQLTSLLNPNPDRPNLTYEFKGVTKVWRWTRERMEEADRQGLIVVPKAGKGIPRFKRYLDEQEGIPVGDFWDDIPIASGAERLGYPTQKPETLLERIIAASSNEGDVVLDPFCGCGTTIAAAQKLNRRWIGIDVTHLAIGLIKSRLTTAYGTDAKYDVIGEPTTVEGAERLAQDDPYQFQHWALGLVGARAAELKKGADKGIDGRLFFKYGPDDKHKQIVISVKAGALHATYVRDLRGVLEREQAEAGVLISFEEPTRKMREEAASAGFFESPWGKHPRLQLLTIAELLAGKGIDYPQITGANQTYKAAPRVLRKVAEELHLDLGDQVAAPTARRRRKRGQGGAS